MPITPLPTYADPEAEHAHLDAAILDALGRVGRTEGWLQREVTTQYETTAAWRDLTASFKPRLVADIGEWAARHDRLDRAARRALRQHGRTEEWLRRLVAAALRKRDWGELPLAHKQKVLVRIETWAAEEHS